MATSGSINFSQDVESLVRDTLYMSNALTPGEDLEHEMSQMVIRAMNRLIKRWQSRGIFVWTYQEAYLFPSLTSMEHTVGNGGTAHFTDSAILTEVATAAAAAATTLVVDSTSGMTAGDYIGVELDDGTRQWTTISTVTNGTTLQLGAALTDDVAVNNTVFTYTDKSLWPLSIYSVRSHSYSSDIETSVRAEDRTYFRNLADKTLTSPTASYFYDRGNQQLGTLSIYPILDNVQDYLKITYERVIQDIDSISDDIDFPSEWYDAIIYNTALSLAPALRIKQSDDLKMLAAQSLQDARRTNTEVDYIETYTDARR